MKPNERQIRCAERIAWALEKDLPEDFTEEAYTAYINENAFDFVMRGKGET